MPLAIIHFRHVEQCWKSNFLPGLGTNNILTLAIACPALTDIGITTFPSGRETSHVVAFSSPSTMTAAPGRNSEAGDYTIECPGHGIGSRTKARIASGLRVSRLGFERHQTRVATPNGYGRVCNGETVMAQTLPRRLQGLELWMCKRLIHVGAMDERVRRVSNDCADAVRLWCCCDVSRCLGLVVRAAAICDAKD